MSSSFMRTSNEDNLNVSSEKRNVLKHTNLVVVAGHSFLDFRIVMYFQKKLLQLITDNNLVVLGIIVVYIITHQLL